MAADGVLDIAAIAGGEVDLSRAIDRVMAVEGTETDTEPEPEPVTKTGQMVPNGESFDAVETAANVGEAGALIPQPGVAVYLETAAGDGGSTIQDRQRGHRGEEISTGGVRGDMEEEENTKGQAWVVSGPAAVATAGIPKSNLSARKTRGEREGGGGGNIPPPILVLTDDGVSTYHRLVSARVLELHAFPSRE